MSPSQFTNKGAQLPVLGILNLKNPKVEGITAPASLSPFQIVQSCAGIEWFSIDRHRLHYCPSGEEEANIFG